MGEQDRSQGTWDCTDRLLFCLVERERSSLSGDPGLRSALNLSQSRTRIFQLQFQSPWQHVVKLHRQCTGRGLSPMRDPLYLHEVPHNLSSELKAENTRQVNVIFRCIEVWKLFFQA